METSGGIRAFARGLAVLRELNVQRFSTALQLSRATQLPRSTVYRLLETLVEAGYVQQLAGQDQYFLRTSVAELSAGIDHQLVVVEAAQTIVRDLSKTIGWPVLTHGYEGDSLVTRQVTSTARLGEGVRVGWTVPILTSSPGRLSLALATVRRRREILANLKHKLDQRTVKAWEGDSLDRLINDVNRFGCGVREGGYVPKTCSFALPINVGEQSCAFLTVVCGQPAVPLRDALRDYLPVARDAVGAIERSASQRIREMKGLMLS